MKNWFKNIFYYWAGLGFLFLARVKVFIQGYSTPKPYGIDDYDKCVTYDLEVVDTWIDVLTSYDKNLNENDLKDKRVLELGPGSDLGVGLYLLSKKVKEYIAVDVNNLMQDVPQQFYNHFFTTLKNHRSTQDIDFLKEELDKTQQGKNDKLDYIVNKNFDIVKALDSRQVDYIFSQAAFEHFDNIDQTIKDMSAVSKPGTILTAAVDLKTHSRWIRDKDPNNIYRYAKWVYRLFTTSGSPNRVRPYEYKKVLEDNGWKNVVIKPRKTLTDDQLESVKKHFYKDFLDDKNQMSYLGIWLCATKA